MIKPDVIIEGPTTDVPGQPKNNVIEWTTVTMPTGFSKDTWLTSIQIKPEFPAVTHPICTAFVPHNPERSLWCGLLGEQGPGRRGSGAPR
jgi:hypothetical protein